MNLWLSLFSITVQWHNAEAEQDGPRLTLSWIKQLLEAPMKIKNRFFNNQYAVGYSTNYLIRIKCTKYIIMYCTEAFNNMVVICVALALQ